MSLDDPARPSLAVLVVDDELNLRKALSVCLETEGHRVLAVSNFRDAVEEAHRRAYDLAFVISASAPRAEWT